MFTTEELTLIVNAADDRAEKFQTMSAKATSKKSRDDYHNIAASYNKLMNKALLLQSGVHSDKEIEAILECAMR